MFIFHITFLKSNMSQQVKSVKTNSLYIIKFNIYKYLFLIYHITMYILYFMYIYCVKLYIFICVTVCYLLCTVAQSYRKEVSGTYAHSTQAYLNFLWKLITMDVADSFKIKFQFYNSNSEINICLIFFTSNLPYWHEFQFKSLNFTKFFKICRIKAQFWFLKHYSFLNNLYNTVLNIISSCTLVLNAWLQF